ncbi:MAG: Uma2 family endonuclease, partial [Acidobacteriota bacterium]
MFDEDEEVSVMTLSLPRNLRYNEWRLKAPTPKLTSAEFLQLCAENKQLDLEMTADGEILVRDKPGGLHANRSAKLTGHLGLWAEVDGIGVGFACNAGFTLPNGAVRSPDLSWMKRERWDALDEEEKETFSAICPDFVAELRSHLD